MEELSTQYPKLHPLLNTLKEGFQSTIRNIVANEVKEKGIRESSKIMEERENLSKIQKQFDDRGVIIEEQEGVIESKDDVIRELRRENEGLQAMLEKHRVNGIQLQDENDRLRVEIDRMHRMEEDIIEKCEMFESTDQDLAIALKEMREQEKQQEVSKFSKYSKEVPKLDLEKVQEIIRLKCESDNLDSYSEEEEEENEGEMNKYYSERNDYEDTSEEEVADPKQNLRALLGDLPSNPKPALFDYEEKKTESEVEPEIDHQNVEFENNHVPSDHSASKSSHLGSDKYVLYDDSSSAGSYYSGMISPANQESSFVPKLNLGGFKNFNTNPQPEKVQIIEPKPPVKMPNLEGLKQKDFQDEFMEKYNEFSDSWREQIEREKRY